MDDATKPAERVGVILPTWLGDTVMATPTIRALRKRFPRPTQLIGIGRPVIGRLLDGTPWFDDFVPYDRHGNRPELKGAAILSQLQALELGTMVVLPNSFSSAWLAWRSGARRRIGVLGNWRSLLLTDGALPLRVDPPARPPSQVDRYLTVATAAGCAPEPRQLELATRPADEVAADQIWERLELDRFPRVILFNTGAATAPAKFWPVENYVALARRLLVDTDAAILVLCGPAEKEMAARIAADVASPRVRSMADQDLGLEVSKAILRRGSLLVTTDSGPRHMAAAFQTPTVALFGPIEPSVSVNYNPNEQMLYLELPCSPCNRKACPLGHHRCMRDLTPDLVARHAVARLVEQQKKLVA